MGLFGGKGGIAGMIVNPLGAVSSLGIKKATGISAPDPIGMVADKGAENPLMILNPMAGAQVVGGQAATGDKDALANLMDMYRG